MRLQDVLLYIDSYPEPTPTSAIGQAVNFCGALDSKLSALALDVDIRAPGNWLAERVLGVSKLVAAEEAKSREAGRSALAFFKQEAERVGVFGQCLTGVAQHHCAAEHVVRAARTRDLCIVPLLDQLDDQRAVVEELIFWSGRPTLVFRPGSADLPSRPEVVAVAWDGSRGAARAVADALPLLERAREVRVFTAINEKPAAISGVSSDLLRHLKSHGVDAVADEVEIGRQKIGEALDGYVKDRGACMLVMGAYGHSKAREFVLGGATEHVLNHMKMPLFLSH